MNCPLSLVLLLALPAAAVCAGHPPEPPLTLLVNSSHDVLIDPSSTSRAELRKTEHALRRALEGTLSNRVFGAGTILGTGPGPWRTQVDILEWISPGELKGAFGPGSPGIAAQASLWDASHAKNIPIAIADFPSPAERFAAAKPNRVLSVDDATHRITEWITARIAEQLAAHPSVKKENIP